MSDINKIVDLFAREQLINSMLGNREIKKRPSVKKPPNRFDEIYKMREARKSDEIPEFISSDYVPPETPKYKYSGNKPKTKKPDVNIEQETIAKGKSKSKGTTIETEMRIKKDLTDKMKKALKKSVISSLENELKGAGLMSDSDSSSSSDEESIKPIKRRGRPKKKSI